MSIENLNLAVSGHVRITDDAGAVVLDKTNAVHPQNISRIIARALANEQNHSIYKIAFGNGGTYIDATGQVSYRTPNDGQLPDSRAWQSRLYNETYFEVIDESSAKFGTGPGANPAGDGSSTGVRSSAAGVQSLVVVTAVLNSSEPDSQVVTSLDPSALSTDFVFDELGLYSPGLPPAATQGYQDVNVGTKKYSDFTYLPVATTYSFSLIINGVLQTISFTTTNIDADLTYEGLAQKINNLLVGAVVQVTRPGVNTYGKIRFVSNTPGSTSSISLVVPAMGTAEYNSWLFANLKDANGGMVYTGIDAAIPGYDGGVEDKAEDQSKEQERLLTHLIFNPLLKTKDRVWTITYTLTISIERSSRSTT